MLINRSIIELQTKTVNSWYYDPRPAVGNHDPVNQLGIHQESICKLIISLFTFLQTEQFPIQTFSGPKAWRGEHAIYFFSRKSAREPHSTKVTPIIYDQAQHHKPILNRLMSLPISIWMRLGGGDYMAITPKMAVPMSMGQERTSPSLGRDWWIYVKDTRGDEGYANQHSQPNQSASYRGRAGSERHSDDSWNAALECIRRLFDWPGKVMREPTLPVCFS